MHAHDSHNAPDDTIGRVPAIDVHAHYGLNARPGRELAIRFQSADAQELARRAIACDIQFVVVSPLLGLMPRGESDPVAGNEDAYRTVRQVLSLLQWVIIDPRKPQTYEQADVMLRSPRCMGIKIHPEEHLYPIKEHGDAIFAFAAARKAVILTHSGEANSMPEDFVPFADAYPEMKLILAHIGCGHDGDMGHQVRAIQRSRRSNIWADTSSAMSIVPNLIEWAVREIGPERVLFGTDSPLYSAAMQRTRIDRADLSEEHKRMILRDNALKLLPMGSLQQQTVRG